MVKDTIKLKSQVQMHRDLKLEHDEESENIFQPTLQGPKP